MSFAEALATAEAESGRDPTCKVGRALADLDDDDRSAFDAAAERGVMWEAMRKAMVGMGYEMAHTTFQRHMRGDCRCDG